jgi:hypothetical protein
LSLTCSSHGNDKNDLRNQVHRELVNHPFQFQKRSQLFIRVHNETVSVAAMRVSNPEGSSFVIDG